MTYDIEFVKMHGLGNDFIIIDDSHLDNIDRADLALLIANQHIGLGCDQLIIYKETANHYEMFIYNTDGSIASICGNALRCLAKLMYINCKKNEIYVKVKDRVVFCKVISDDKFSVNMGKANFSTEWMPQVQHIWNLVGRYGISLKDLICADLGNPHLVIFGKFNSNDMFLISKMLQESNLFPNGININFAYVNNKKIYLSVWERGVGFTLACGSGACATFACATEIGLIDSDKAEIIFSLGSLFMSNDNDNIIMIGPATLVAHGKFYYAK